MGGVESTIQAINGPINSIVWGWPTVLLIAATGILLMVGLRFMPLQRLSYGISMMLRPAASQTEGEITPCLLYTSPSPRDLSTSRMPSSA